MNTHTIYNVMRKDSKSIRLDSVHATQKAAERRVKQLSAILPLWGETAHITMFSDPSNVQMDESITNLTAAYAVYSYYRENSYTESEVK